MKKNTPRKSAFCSENDISLEELHQLCGTEADFADFPLASSLEKNVLVYDGDELRRAVKQGQSTEFQSEMAAVFSSGPGVLVLKDAYGDTTVIDRMNIVFDHLFEEQRLFTAGSDHFSKAGENSRIWNTFQKSALHSPDAYIDYYKNPLIRLVAESWLGPHYQLTAQVNVVHPGGRAQICHRDYHLGFQENDEVSRYPLHAQIMSQYLTLQGAVAHSDMPVESGPTLFLPYSHLYPLGYLAWRDERFRDYFARHAVQLPLLKGDAVFFNPALLHAAGANDTPNIHRIANLLQISSPFARAMENVDLYQIVGHIYSTILEKVRGNALTDTELNTLIMNSCDGYSFPSNLDTDPPRESMAPLTVEELCHNAVREEWSDEIFKQALQSHFAKRQP
ncbi:MAG: phytanoyl-CoA dioxygenase family protein [SAR324 cluster bacterium]|nr:phytanoyl-CoA dioxygenase family protein [SAR324 cluster bacterium]